MDEISSATLVYCWEIDHASKPTSQANQRILVVGIPLVRLIVLDEGFQPAYLTDRRVSSTTNDAATAQRMHHIIVEGQVQETVA